MLYIKNISSIRIADSEKCTGCGMCIEVCPHSVFEISNRKVSFLKKDACMECGACKQNCPFGVIEVNAGVGCAHAIINGMINKTEPICGCSDDSSDKPASCC